LPTPTGVYDSDIAAATRADATQKSERVTVY